MALTDKKTIAVLGMFDGMHLGHRAVFERAQRIKMMTGLPIAVFTFRVDVLLPKFGGRRDILLMSAPDRRKEIEALDAGLITEATKDFLDLNPEEFFDSRIKKAFNAGFVVCGEDFRFGKGRAGDVETLKALCEGCGMELCTVPIARGGKPFMPISSTRIREMLREGDITGANELLGHEMYYTLPVESGRQLGRTIGFPTINQRIPEIMVRPKYGVYASRVVIDGTEYPAMTDIGVKPTVESDGSEIMETHIIGFDGDLYGSTVRVYLRGYIRGEKKFRDIGELKEQLASDKENAVTHK